MALDRIALLRRMFDAAVAAADPRTILPRHLPAPPAGRTVVLAFGKAAAMAKAFEEHWPGPFSGLAVVPYGHGLPCRRIEVLEAAHPVPDQASEAAARRALHLVEDLSENDLVVALISGGGSALLAGPPRGISLADKQAISKALLRSGASIAESNCLRKHLSAIKGGRLAAAAYPAQLVSLAISDVAGDDPSIIASGPTVADPTTRPDALAVLEKYAIAAPASVLAHLRDAGSESPKPGDPRLSRSRYAIIGSAQMALEAAAAVAAASGVRPLILGEIEGEARDAALVHAGIARQIARHGQPAQPPAVLLSGGETSVTVRGGGRGGRNGEFLLALAIALRGEPAIHALAADTDGIDGGGHNAGAVLGPDCLARAEALGLSPRRMLADNDAFGFFSALGDLLVTGPTRTNVNDFRAILIDPPGKAG